MRDPQRIDRILGMLREAWYANPDQRLGQLVFNIVNEEPGRIHDIFYVEDDDLEATLREQLGKTRTP